MIRDANKQKMLNWAEENAEVMDLVVLRHNGAVVNLAVAIGCAEGIVKSGDNNLFSSNGGHITLTKHWATGSR